MGLFLSAADAWTSLLSVKYNMILGFRNKSYDITLSFELRDFPHLAGMQYAKDVDFQIPRKEYYGEQLIFALQSGILDDKLIENGRNWEKIKGRLEAILALEQTLDDNFVIYLFDRRKLSIYSDIKATYVIKSELSDKMFFVFLDKDNGRAYCKSAFAKHLIDFSQNQSRLTLLKKVKMVNDEIVLTYVHPNYKPER